MGARYSYEEVKAIIEGANGNGCKLISKEYTHSHDKLDIECKCGNLFKTSISKFVYQNKRQCNDCGKKNKSEKQSKSNGQFKNELREIVGDEIIPLEVYRGVKNEIYFKHIICGHKWKTTPDNMLNGSGSCPKCSRKRSTYEFKVLVKNKFGDYYKVLGTYIDSKTPILMLHETCGNEFESTPDIILNNLPSLHKNECPKCNNRHLKTTEEFKKDVYELVGDEYIVLSEYNGAREKILMYHASCENKYYTTPDSFLNKKAKCSCRNTSNGELSILEYLNKNKLNYIQQIRFKECKNKTMLPFDFGVMDDDYNLICLIEFDGIQHFEPIEFFGGKEAFDKLKYNDSLKDKYCEENNIKLIRISYIDFNNIEYILDSEFESIKDSFLV